MTSLRGSINQVDCRAITGWAWDRNSPDDEVSVDVYDEADLIATVPASVHRADLFKAGIGNGDHGFAFPSPDRLKDGRPHTLRIRFAGTAIDLARSPQTLSCATGSDRNRADGIPGNPPGRN